MRSRNSKITLLFVEHTGTIIGGGQFSVLGLLKTLREKKYEVHVTVPQKGDYYEMLKENGFTPMIADVNRFKGRDIIRLPEAVKQMRKLIIDVKADIVHANSARAALVSGLACVGTGIPVIWHLRVPGREPLYDFLLTILSKRIIAISSFVATRIKSLRKKVIVIHNGVEPSKKVKEEEIISVKKELGIGEGPVIGTVCQLIPSKGLESFIKAGAVVIKNFPQAYFLIVGGEVADTIGYEKKLRQLSEQFNIADRVIFTGFKRDVYTYYTLMDVFVFFTELEAFGRVVAEAMMTGIPVVSTNVGGIPEIVEDGKTGYLFPVRNENMAAEKIIFLLNNPSLRRDMGQKGKERAEKLFSVRQNAEKIDALYKELLNIMK